MSYKRVVYYARVSTEEGKQLDALENQKTMLSSFINDKEDWDLVGSYIDEGKSGTSTKNRKEYNRLYNDLLDDKFDIVVIKDQSRLCRNVLDWYTFVDRLLKNEKKLFFYSEKQFYKPDEALITGVKALLAAEYSRDLSRKVNEGNRQRQKAGVVFGNNRIWGYDHKNGKLFINEEESKVVRKIFDWYIEGKGFRIIYKLLEDEGVRNRNGNPFAMTTLKRIIRNEKYKGVLIANRYHKDFDTKKQYENPESEWIIHKDVVPAIVSEEIWDKANEILNTKKRKNNISDKEVMRGYFKGTHLFSTKIICGHCSKTYWHAQQRYWQCQEYRNFGLKKENKNRGCINYKIYDSELEQIIKEIIFDFWKNKDTNIKKVIDVLNQVLESNNYNDSVKNLFEKKIKLDKKKNKIIDMYSEDLLTKEEYIDKKQDIDKQLENIKKQIRVFEEKNKNILSKKQRVEEIQKIVDRQIDNVDSIDEEITEYFLQKIIVKNDNELDIYLNGDFEYIVKKMDNQYSFYQNVTEER